MATASAMEATEFNISNSVPSPPMATGNNGQEATDEDEEGDANGTSALSAVDMYRMEWLEIVSSLDNNMSELRDVSFAGELKGSKFRSVTWALLLRVLNDDPSMWAKQREQQRNRYEQLKLEFARNPYESVDLNNDDPLSQSKQSIWNQYFGDQELFAVIKQDVVRTFPGVEFFRKTAIQDAMTNILFYYAREHPYMCYRQGMHEILAPILFVMFSDHQSLQHFLELSEQIDKLLLIVLDPRHLEADSYAIFSRVMSSIESYYRIANLVPTAEGYFPPQMKPVDPSQETLDGTTEVEIIGQLNFIRDKILAKEDLHLHNRFLKLEIPLHIFGIRWLRLLFGREFSLMDLLMIWDAIFADSDRFELPNYILVAMLIRIREKLLLSDYTTCLTYLMRYPTNVDIGLILRHALHMYMPKKFDRPPHAFIYITTQPSPDLKTIPAQSRLSSAALLPNKPIARNDVETRSRTLSVMEKRTQNELKELQRNYARQSARISKLRAEATGDRVIIDGLSENSPEITVIELQNAHTIISVAKLKLRKYLTTIRKHVNRTHSEDLNQAVEGIEELCEFLDVKFSIPNTLANQQVDPALEANEHGQIFTPIPVATSSPEFTFEPMPIAQQRHRLTELEAKRHFIKSLDSFEVDIDRNGQPSGFQRTSMMATAMTTDPNVPVINGTRYEIPDNGFMLNSAKILGNRTDVELTLFKEERDRGGLQSNSAGGVPNVDPVGNRDAI